MAIVSLARRWRLAAVAALAAALCSPAFADLAAGMDALAVKDFVRARSAFEREPENAQAIYQLSRMAWYGYGEPRNPTRRFGLLQRAAALGHARAQFEMAWMLGAGDGTPADPQRAMKLLEQYDAEGNVDATVLLGRVLRFGWWGIAADDARAVALLKKASGQGSDIGTTLYASALVQGIGGAADSKTGLELLRGVADKGFVDAQMELARILSFGLGGVPKDEAGGYALYLAVARQGEPFAQYMTCMAHFDGRGVARDPATAARWCDAAAQQGDAYAQMRLGDMFRTGTGMPRLPSQAYYWYTVASHASGSAGTQASERRARIAQELQQADIERQTKRAASFRPQPGLRARETPLPALAHGDRVKLGDVAVTIPLPKGYFNNWQFVENLQRLTPNNPELQPNLMVLSNQEDMDRFRLGLAGGIRSLEVNRHSDEEVNVTPAIFVDVRKKLLEMVEKTRSAGRMKVEVARDDDTAFAIVRESLTGSTEVDARAWIRVNGRVLVVAFSGFSAEQLQDLRTLVAATTKEIVAQNGRGGFNLFGSNPN
jgi:hypothetical protein